MDRNYEIGCSLFMVDNQSFVTLFIYSSAVREKVLVGFCGKLIIKFAFEFEIEELRSDRRWIEMFLSKKVGICFNCNKLLLFRAAFNLINDRFTQLNNLFK